MTTATTEAMRLAREALALASIIADRVPSRWHQCLTGTAEHDIGSLINAQPDGTHGYQLIHDALAAIDALPSAPAWPCHCDERGIGKPGVTCGGCPRDYGHTVDSAPRGEQVEFDHDIGADRFKVVKGPFWWHIRIGDSTGNVGKFHNKLAAEDVALKMLTAFRDGAYMQYHAMRATPQAAPAPQAAKASVAGLAEPPLVSMTISVARGGGITSDVVTHDNSYADVAVGLAEVKAEIERVFVERAKCPYFPRTAEDARKPIPRTDAAPQAAPVPAPSELEAARWEGIQSVQAQTSVIVQAALELLDAVGDNFLPETLAAFRRVFGGASSTAAAAPEPMRDKATMPLDMTDIARIWRKVYGGQRADSSAFEFADAIMRAALAAHAAADPAPAVPAEPDRAWLVEWRWNGVQWLYLIGRRFSFTADPNAALRFARRADAEAALAWVEAHDGTGALRRLGEMLATEHEWVATTPQEAPARYGLTEAACQWGQEDEGSGTYWSACGHGFTFNDGGPTDNGLKHCCYCGKPLIELPWVEPEPDAGIATPAAPKGQQ